MTVTAKVERGLCQGHGMCWMAAGEVFLADDEGYSYVEMQEVPEELHKKVADAEQMCPEFAIVVSRDA